MAETIQRDYQSFSDMGRPSGTGLGTRFFVNLSGQTKGAHQAIVAKLRGIGHIEVFYPEESDYLLVFCPVTSRVGTDISEALENIPGGKPIILVVMHHTFSTEQVVAPSRRQVENPNVRLTVDCLFYEGKFPRCNRNDIAWGDIQKTLGVSPTQDIHRDNRIWCSNKWMLIIILAVMASLVIIVTLSVTLTEEEAQSVTPTPVAPPNATEIPKDGVFDDVVVRAAAP